MNMIIFIHLKTYLQNDTYNNENYGIYQKKCSRGNFGSSEKGKKKG